eukprot:c9784_g1_i1.p1 GENE.c9784_g1_i1~~c9784_g1_i1.p1  ORF type:complete len:747 (+),score=203.09 c9784_g1_i1:325-2241(+)
MRTHNELQQQITSSVAKSSKNWVRTRDMDENGKVIQNEIEDLNQGVLDHERTHSLKTAHDLIDTMGEAAEVDKLRVAFAYRQLFRRVILYCILLSFFMAMSIPRDDARFNVSKMFSNATPTQDWLAITDIDGLWSWADKYLHNTTSFFDFPITDTIPIGFFLLGSVRFRQIQSKGQSCDKPSNLDSIDSLLCLPFELDPSTESRSPLSWKSPITGSTDYVQQNLKNARLYQEAEGASWEWDTDAFSTSGYFVDLDFQSHSTENAEIISALNSKAADGSTWIGPYTRFVAVQVNLFNLNLLQFASCILRLQMRASGQILVDSDVLSFSFERESLSTYPSIGFKVASAAVTLFMFGNLIGTALRVGIRRALSRFHVWFDLLIGALTLVVLIIDCTVSQRIRDKNIDFSDTETFQDLYDINRALQSETFVVASVILVMWLRLIKYSVLMPKFGRVTYAFMNTMKNFEVLSYLLFVFFVIFGYICAFRLSFEQTLETSTYEGTFNLLMQMMMGGWPEDVFSNLSNIMRTVMFISFMISIAIVFLNLFISVLSEVYPREKRRAAVQCDDNLTILMERDYILATHSFIEGHSTTWFGRTIATPLLVWASMLFRFFRVGWNLEVPEKEFGWEKGRHLYRKNLAEE